MTSSSSGKNGSVAELLATNTRPANIYNSYATSQHARNSFKSIAKLWEQML